MVTYTASRANPVALAGDWHGNLAWAQKVIRSAAAADAGLIVQLGDFGYWRPDPSTRKYLFRVERLLAELGMQLWWIDGNHEDHPRLRVLPLAEDGTRPISEHVVHLPRGFRFTVEGDGRSYTWLAVGGAVSLDRQWRTPGRSWWPEERLTDDDIAVALRGGPADVLISHDAPLGVDVPDPRRGRWPEAALAEADEHRALLRVVVDGVRPRQLWHGHFHVQYDADLALPVVDGGESTCAVHGLDCDGSEVGANLALVSASGQRITPAYVTT